MPWAVCSTPKRALVSLSVASNSKTIPDQHDRISHVGQASDFGVGGVGASFNRGKRRLESDVPEARRDSRGGAEKAEGEKVLFVALGWMDRQISNNFPSVGLKRMAGSAGYCATKVENSAATCGLPKPVTKSYFSPALYPPSFPEVTS